MTSHSRLFLVALALVTGPVPPCDAQDPDSAAQTEARVMSTLSRVRPGSLLRVRHEDQQTPGRSLGVTADSLLLVQDGTRRGVPVRGVDAIWARRTPVRTGAATGAAIGAVAVAGFGLSIVTGICDKAGGCADEIPGVALVGGAVGGAAGGLIGAALGSPGQRWKRLY